MQWLALMRPTVKGNTFAASYRNPVEKHIIPHFGKQTLDEIRQADIQRYINKIAKDFAHDTVKKHKSRLFQIFEMAIINDLCVKNPVRQIIIPKTKERLEKAVYTEKQERMLFNYGYFHRFGAEIQFMIATGVARGELLALRWEDIDFSERAVYIRHGAAIVPNEKTGKLETIIGEPKTRYRKRGIPLGDELCRILKELPRHSEFVFCNSKGNVCNPRTWQRRHFDVFMQDMHEHYAEKGLNIPAVCPHQLRHTRLSLWINSGKNPIATAKVGGHANMNMLLKRYVHSSIEDLREQLGIE
jgi:integrase